MRYDTAGEDGFTRREHNEARGVSSPEAEEPPGFERLFRAFAEMSARRSLGFNAPQPITYQDVQAYADAMGEKFTRRDVRAIMAMESGYQRHLQAKFDDEQRLAQLRMEHMNA